MSDITDWKVFTRAAELNNLSAAGRDLRMSSAVISNRIAKLEQQLGVRLLNRTTRRVSLTDEGQLFYDRSIKILQEIEELEQDVGARRESPRGSLAISAPAGFGKKHIAPFLPAFVDRHPDLEVKLRLTDHLVDLIHEGADIAIRIADLKNYSFIARKLASNTRAIVASPDYLKRHGTPKAPEDLLDHECLLLRFPGSQQFQWTLEGPERTVTLPVSGRIDSDNGEVLLNWCRDGAGISLKSMWEVGADLKSGRLIAILPEWKPLAHAIYALYPHSQLLPPRARAFIDFFAEIYGPRPYWETGDDPPVLERLTSETDTPRSGKR